MTIPSTNISLNSIQTELGGSNPISINEYYRGGSIVHINQTSPSGTIPASASGGQIDLAVFRGVVKYVDVWVGTVSNNIASYGQSSESVACEGSITFTPAGTIELFGAQYSSGSTQWCTPIASTAPYPGNNYWIKLTRTSGVMPSGMVSGTIYSLSASRTVYVTNAAYLTIVQSLGTIDIYSDAGGTTRVGGGLYGVNAEVGGGSGGGDL